MASAAASHVVAGSQPSAHDGDAVDLSIAQDHQLQTRFAMHYSTRLAESQRVPEVNAKVSVLVEGLRRYGTVHTIVGNSAHVVLDGRGSQRIERPLSTVLLRRTQLSRSTKLQWARELCVLGGAEAISRAYSKWVAALEPLLVVERHKDAVLSALVGTVSITRAAVRDACDRAVGCPSTDEAATAIFDTIKQDSVFFKRRTGRGDSFQWTLAGKRQYQVRTP